MDLIQVEAENLRKVVLGHWLEETEKVPQVEAGFGLEMEVRG